jgi:hypothetical protein
MRKTTVSVIGLMILVLIFAGIASAADPVVKLIATGARSL